MVDTFKQWGKPDWIKVDNGLPFGDPQLQQIMPIASWLISYGVNMIWNRPRTPQDNAKVERNQGTLANWVDLEYCKTTADLQKKVREQGIFYNHHFPNRRKDNKTKTELFPTLLQVRNDWNKEDFDFKRFLKVIAQNTYERKVSKKGQIYIYGHRFSVGVTFKNQIVTIKLDHQNNQWKIFEDSGQPIRAINTKFSNQSILNLNYQ